MTGPNNKLSAEKAIAFRRLVAAHEEAPNEATRIAIREQLQKLLTKNETSVMSLFSRRIRRGNHPNRRTVREMISAMLEPPSDPYSLPVTRLRGGIGNTWIHPRQNAPSITQELTHEEYVSLEPIDDPALLEQIETLYTL